MPELNTDAALQRILQLLEIPGKSCEERRVAEVVVQMLREAGVAEAAISFDDAHTKTPAPGDVGNLIVKIPGTKPGPITLLSAHMDTVPICVGCKPEIQGDRIVSVDPNTGLGGDNRGGVATILTTAIELLQSELDYGPLVLCFFVQEEIGLQGSRNLDVGKIGKVDYAVNFDGGTVEKLTVGATGGERMAIEIYGHPSHAGVSPESGVNASTIFALAAAKLHQDGWLGRVTKESGSGTSNIGVVQGGEATNVVLPHLSLRAEARSHDSAFRSRIVSEYRQAFESMVNEVKSIDGKIGRVEFTSRVDYDSFRLAEDSASVVAAAEAIKSIGRTPFPDIAGGGLDANWLFKHGIEAVTLGCGQSNIHTVDEELIIADYLDACRVAMQFVLTAANGN